jgi:hypothetical protein
MTSPTAPPTALAAAALAAGFAIAGCLVAAPPPPPQQPGAAEPPVYVATSRGGPVQDGGAAPASGVIPGNYSCTIEDYAPFRCVVFAGEDGALQLEKLEGSQRFRGRVFPADGGFDFEGTFFCPWGDCTQEVASQFREIAPGVFRGEMRTANVQVVTLRHVIGGWSYGGAAYGGGAYGGAGYGIILPMH